MKYISIALLLALFVFQGCSKKEADDPISKVETVSISLPTIMCNMCVKTITKAVYSVEGVKEVKVSVEEKSAKVTFVPLQTNLEVIEAAISEAGYDANTRKRNQDAYAQLPECCKNDG